MPNHTAGRLCQAVLALVLVAALPEMAVGQNSVPVTGDARGEVAEEIERQVRSMREAMEQGNVAEVAEHFTEDAAIFLPNMPPTRGRPAIEKGHQALLEAGLSIESETIEIAAFGDVAYEISSYRTVNASGEAVDHGRYMVIWKQVDGRWKLHRDFVSSNTGQALPKPGDTETQERR